MTEFHADSEPVRQQREIKYDLIDWETAVVLADYIDQIVDMSQSGRSAISRNEQTSEWVEIEGKLPINTECESVIWTQRMSVRRDILVDKSYDDQYTIIMNWECTGVTLLDPNIIKIYYLTVGENKAFSDPTLKICYQPTTTEQSINREENHYGNNESMYHTADRIINRNTYRIQTGYQYDVDLLFDELIEIERILISNQQKML